MSINIANIDNVLENLAILNEKRFNAHQIAILSNEKEVLKVNDYLVYRSTGDFGILEARIETLCPKYHPDYQLKIEDKFPNYEIECYICGEEYIPDLNFSHLVFYFRNEYLEDVKKKKLLEQELVI